jgi:DNA polymerase-1
MSEAARPYKRLYLIDALSYVFRAYHAPTPVRFASPEGVPTNAVFLFHNMLRKLLREHQPDYAAVVFDPPGPTVRDELFKEYKAQRAPMPDDLAAQLPYIRRLCAALRLSMLEHAGYEADDVIATLARRAAGQNLEAVIVTSDKDMLQLVRTTPEPAVRVFSPTKELFYDEAEVKKYFGVPPEQVVEAVALMGDAIDNIPGARGIGEKGARDLIGRYGSVEAAMAHAAEVKHKKYRVALLDQQEQIRLSKKLATLHADLPLPLEPERLAVQPPDAEQLAALFSELGFTSLLKEQLPAGGATSAAVDVRRCESPEEWKRLLAETPRNEVAVWAEAAGASPLDLRLTALGFSAAPGKAFECSLETDRHSWLAAARGFFEDRERPKAVHDAKAFMQAVAAEGIEPAGVEHDTALYSYLLNPTTAKHALEDVAARRLMLALGSGAGERAELIGRLAAPLRAEIEAQGLTAVYEHIERPLAPVLAALERTGVRLDPKGLDKLAAESEREIAELTRRIYELAGAEFNLNSPRQLGEILFEKLQLPLPRRRGRAPAASTAADVLEELAPLHELPARVLEYRELAKLKSTYIDVLPGKIHPQTGRLHTTFHQTGTATGRLSSSDPNLQNIPVRGELGTLIRAAFVAEPGWRLVSADYSQIELRVLAHLSEDPVLVTAFERGEDIHARTAEEVLGVAPLMQTSEHRRIAKMINFGILYGLTAYGLGPRLGLEPAEAQKYIDAYFRRYAGVKAFREMLLEEARRTGYTKTLFGRRRPFAELNSRNAAQRNFAERAALNAPLQGSAADIIKLAMIRLAERLRREGLRARMLLQVHDELLLEAPAEEAERAARWAKETMERVELPPGTVYAFRVPLVVMVGSGENWASVKAG